MSFKTMLDIAEQKVTGMTQGVKGDLEIKSGQTIKGTITKIRGKANEAEADLKATVQKK